jgi:hypothetical protein
VPSCPRACPLSSSWLRARCQQATPVRRMDGCFRTRHAMPARRDLASRKLHRVCVQCETRRVLPASQLPSLSVGHVPWTRRPRRRRRRLATGRDASRGGGGVGGCPFGSERALHAGPRAGCTGAGGRQRALGHIQSVVKPSRGGAEGVWIVDRPYFERGQSIGEGLG